MTRLAPVRPALERVRELLAYDPETGVLTWRQARGGMKAGDRAGYVAPNGYVYVSVDDTLQLAHLLIWLMETGAWPETKVDHRDRIRTNNRWPNLRLATDSQSAMNVSLRKDNSTGVRGVCRRPRGWEAYINVNGKRLALGHHPSLDVAAAARRQAELEHFGEFATCS